MAPIELDTSNSNTLPYLFLGAYVAGVVSLTVLVARSLRRASSALQPSQAVRSRQKPRDRHVQAFVGLAGLALVISLGLQLQAVGVSYDTWATERGLKYPTTLYGPGGIIGGGKDTIRMQLGHWLRDTNFRLDSAEVAVERSRRFWWAQQSYLGSAAWAVFVGIEGLKRNIPHLWAFLALSQLVSLSYAQNLFCLAVLFAPVSLTAEGSHHLLVSTAVSPKNVRFSSDSRGGQTVIEKVKTGVQRYFAQKPASWTPYPALHIFPLAVSSIAIFLLPFAAGTSTFTFVRSFPAFHTYVHGLLPFFVPETWGSVSRTPKQRTELLSSIFRFLAVVSLALHVKATAVALIDNTPNSHRHRHSFPFFVPVDEQRSKLERSRTAVGNLFGAISDHPAVTAVGSDVILSSISVMTWSYVRALDSQTLLSFCIPYYNATVGAIKENVKLVNGPKKPRRKSKSASDAVTEIPASTTKKTPRRKKAAESDESYTPDDRSSADIAESGEEITSAEPESGALAWGLVTLTGLGAAAASVWGADVIQYA
ncbi:MAG: hypothetical protein M1814_001148 [Vezdaea aestivalis]|nr:MAG: hypothetical protein M1814_001148 [Vezdaea aestivalis]